MESISIGGSECTGCSACAVSCPKNAIKMTTDAEGFLYPVIDNAKCVRCGLCRKICPAIDHVRTDKPQEPDCYAAFADDGNKKGSSSGGIFSVLAVKVLTGGGFVCGAAFTPDMNVRHRIVFDVAGLAALKGSKYVQSEIGDCFSEIKKLIADGKKGMFVGTPCQVAGLKAFLHGKTDNLLLIDLFCHSVPSAKVFKRYLSSLIGTKDECVIKVDFRDRQKNIDYASGAVTVITDKNVYSRSGADDPFMQAFLHNLSVRKSCGSCVFSQLPRQGDITLGDFWGIGNYDNKLKDGDGVSAVLVNTETGRRYWSAVFEHLSFCRKMPYKYVAAGNPCLSRPFPLHPNRDAFYADLDKRPFAENVKMSLHDKCDCAILNLWHTNNYGALLTCYALAETLKSAGYRTKVVKYIPDSQMPDFLNGLSEAFSGHFDLTDIVSKDEDFKKLNDIADTFIVGSDQVFRWWNDSNNYPYGYSYFLPCLSSSKKKIAYAASFGKDVFDGTFDVADKVRFYLKDFDAVSVREDSGVEICRRDLGIAAAHVMDPVFIVETKVYDDLTAAAGEKKKEKPFIAAYLLEKTRQAADIIAAAKSVLSVSDVLITDDAAKEKDARMGRVSVEQWLYNIKNAEFLITDSFHGVCFAIIFNVPFVCVPNFFRGYGRISSLLGMLGLKERCVVSPDADIDDLIRFPIDWEKVNSVLKAEKDRSLSWLLAKVAAKAKDADPAFDVIRDLTLKVDALTERVNELTKLKRTALSYEIASYAKPFGWWRYFRYWLASKIFFGKKRRRYLAKYLALASRKKHFPS